MNFRMLWERITAAVAAVSEVWQRVSASLAGGAEGLKAERIQEPAAPDDPETGSDDG